MSPGLLQLTTVRYYSAACSRCRTLLRAWSQALVGATTSHRCCSSCTGCQSNNGLCLRLLDSSTSHLLERPPRTSLMTAACCRMPAIARCGRIPMNCGICSYCAHTANYVTEASQSPVPAFGTTFHQDYDGRD